MGGAHPTLGEARPEAGRRGGERVVGLAEQHPLHQIEAAELLLGGEFGVVGDVVGVTGEGVKGMDVAAERAADEEGAHREVLIAAVLARPQLDARRPAHAALSW